MQNSRIKTIFVLGLFSVILTACGSQPPVPVSKYYHFPSPAMNMKQATRPLYKNIFVQRPVASGIYNDRAMLNVSISKPLELSRYHYHFWEKSPSLIVRDSIVNYLKKMRVAERITSKNGTQADMVVDTRILRFEQIKAGSESYALVRIEFNINNSNGDIFTKEYEGKVKSSGSDMHSVVLAFGKAMDLIMKQFSIEIIK